MYRRLRRHNTHQLQRGVREHANQQHQLRSVRAKLRRGLELRCGRLRVPTRPGDVQRHVRRHSNECHQLRGLWQYVSRRRRLPSRQVRVPSGRFALRRYLRR